MSEQLPNLEQIEQAEPSNEELLATTFGELKKKALRIQGVSFKSVEAANVVKDLFIKESANKLSLIPDVKSIPLVIGGNDVYVPDVSLNHVEMDEIGQGIFVSLAKTQMRSLLPMEQLKGRLNSIYGTIVTPRDESGIYVRLAVLATMHERRQEAVALEGTYDLNAIEVNVVQRALVNFSSDNFILPEQLYQRQEKEKLRLELFQKGLAKSAFQDSLNQLGQAFHNEETEKYIKMDKVKIIHSLGSYGSREAQRGEEYSTVVRKAILNQFGQERIVQVSYHETLEKDIVNNHNAYGKVVEVLMPVSEDDDTEPAIVIEDINSAKADQPIHLVKFDSIHSLSF